MAKFTTRIVKNEKFETIGIEVTNGKKTLYRWGISPSGLNYVKECFQENIDEKIFELVKLDGKLESLARFNSLFFDVLIDSGELTENKGYRMKAADDEVERIKNRMGHIISTIE